MGSSKTSFVRGSLLCALALTALLQAQTAPPASTQTTTLTEPPAPLLPTNERLVLTSSPDTRIDDKADQAATKPGDAAVLKECGLKRQESRTVLAPPSGKQIPDGYVLAYQFVDATGALSAYTYFRQAGKPHVAPAGLSESVLPDGEFVVLDGVSVVRTRLKQDRAAADTLLTTIEVGLPKVNGRRGLPPLLPSLLPGPGLAPDTLRYSLGPVSYGSMGGVLPAGILAWGKSAEVATAHYAGKSGDGTLTLLMYPTPEIAGDQARAIQGVIDGGATSDLRTAKLRRIGPLLALASNGFTSTQAATLLHSVHLNQEVILDKAMPTEFHTEIRKTVTLLEQIAIFIGVGILAALVLGVFFGGGRAAIRVMQGKPAWVDPEFLHIDLRGKPEPLRSEHQQRADISPQ